MSSVRETVLATVLSAYNAARPSGVPAAERSRSLSAEPQQLPLTVLIPVKEPVEPAKGRFGPLVVRTLRFQLWHRAAAGGGLSADQAVDPLLAWGTKALCGKRPGTPLGDLVIDLQEKDLEWTVFEGESDAQTCLVIHTFEASYTTRVNDAELRV